MVQAFGMMQLAQLALRDPDAAARIVAASGAVPPTADETSTLLNAPNLVDQPVLPGQPPAAVPAQPGLLSPSAPPVPPRKPTPPRTPETPSEPGEEGALLQQLFSGVDASAIQPGGQPQLPAVAAPVGKGSPGASQLQQIIALLTGGAAPPPAVPSLGALIRGG